MMPALWEVLAQGEVQFVLLGTGQSQYEQAAAQLGQEFPDRTAIYLAFSEALAEKIYAALDIFLMPSLFEPCGIGQMISMRYGGLPLVRAVGGLVDTVPADVGFLFDAYDAGALGWALQDALYRYNNDQDKWRERQQRAMKLDFSWDESARQYTALYEEAIEIHKRYQ